MDIMDHRSFQTTEGYCRIRQARRREAVDLEHRWQWDAEGNQLEQKIIERFAESEDVRAALGSTAIPTARVSSRPMSPHWVPRVRIGCGASAASTSGPI
jgi:hypothetical protein